MERLDAAYVEGVIASRMCVDYFHNKMRGCAFKQGHAILLYESHLQPSDRASGKMITEVLPIFRQYASAKAPGERKNPVHQRAIVERDEDQGGSSETEVKVLAVMPCVRSS